MEASMAELLVAHQKLESCLFSLGIRNVLGCPLVLARWQRLSLRTGELRGGVTFGHSGLISDPCGTCQLGRVLRCDPWWNHVYSSVRDVCLWKSLAAENPVKRQKTLIPWRQSSQLVPVCYAKCPPFQRKVCELFRLAVTHFLDLPALGLTPVHWDDEASIVAAESLAMSSASRCSTGHLSPGYLLPSQMETEELLNFRCPLANPSLVPVGCFPS